MLRKITDGLAEYLRINAIRRMLAIVDVKSGEMIVLLAFAITYAVFEGVGLSLLLPILQYAEGGEAAVIGSSGPIWSAIESFMNYYGLPMTLPVLLSLAFVPILLRQVVFYFNAWYSAVVAANIGVRMRMYAVRRILKADPIYFARHPLGELSGIIITQTVAAGLAVIAVMKQLTIALLIVLYIAILFAISAPLTMVTILSAALVSWAVRINVLKIRDFGVDAARVFQEMSAKTVERLAMIRLVKMRNQGGAEAERILSYSDAMRAVNIRQARLGANIEVTADPLLMLSVFVTLYMGIAVMGLTLAEMGLLLFVLTRLNAKVKEFNIGRQTISTNIAGLLLVHEATEAAEMDDTIRSGPLEFNGLQDRIEFREVGFAYTDATTPDGVVRSKSEPVLDGVNLSIPAGSFTAVVGRSGAGKSTLVDLLPRLQDVTSGAITFDDVDIREFDVGSFRKGIGYLTQSAELFNDSLRQNLCYGLDSSPTDEQIAEAVARAHASFIWDLPEGLDTNIGDRGVRFSGGERQRIALARVLLANCSVLILDEPTSALDSESETYIQDALARMHGEKTIIVVAHRLATVVRADQIVVIEAGHVQESGTHQELLARRGAYQKLFESQLLS